MSEHPKTSFELVGSPAVVTGGAQGIGFEIGRQLLDHGADLMIFDINGEGAEAARAELSAAFPQRTVLTYEGDVAEEADWRACFDLAKAELGVPRILVNNALHNELRPIVSYTVEEWERIFAVISRGTFLGCREIGRRFMEDGLDGPAAVVNISTLNYTNATPGLAAYSAAKASVSQFTKAAAMEFAPLGIRVNAIAPGLVRTPLAERFFGDSPEVPEAFVARTPMGRVGMPIDEARAAVFLAGEASGWITGITLNVDGGMHTDGVPDNWELMKGPLGLSDPEPWAWLSGLDERPVR